MADYQVLGWTGWYHLMELACLGQFFILRQQMLFTDPLPLLSAVDIVTLLDHYLPCSQQTFDGVYQAMLKSYRKRFRDIEYCFLNRTKFIRACRHKILDL